MFTFTRATGRVLGNVIDLHINGTLQTRYQSCTVPFGMGNTPTHRCCHGHNLTTTERLAARTALWDLVAHLFTTIFGDVVPGRLPPIRISSVVKRTCLKMFPQ